MRLPFLNFPIRPYEGLPCPSKSLTYLTNREALTVLCCKARRKRLEHEKRLGGNTRRSRVFLPTSWVLFLGALFGCSWVLSHKGKLYHQSLLEITIPDAKNASWIYLPMYLTLTVLLLVSRNIYTMISS